MGAKGRDGQTVFRRRENCAKCRLGRLKKRLRGRKSMLLDLGKRGGMREEDRGRLLTLGGRKRGELKKLLLVELNYRP